MQKLLVLMGSIGLLSCVFGCGQARESSGDAIVQNPGAKNADPRLRADADDDEPESREQLEGELAIAVEKTRSARVALEHQRAESRDEISQAEKALERAGRKLDDFRERQAPIRIEEARVELASSRNDLLEAEEELQQLEMMYAEEDLSDKTREIVLDRGRRRLDLSRQAAALQQEQLEHLEDSTLPLEASDLEAAFVEKTNELKAAKRSAEAGAHEKRIELMEAELEVVRVKAKLANLDPQDASKEKG